MQTLTGRRVGYARVSTLDQNLDLQRDALKAAGCETIWEDRKSAASPNRQGLRNLLADLEPGDTLVVWRLDRLARSITQLLQILEELRSRNVQFLSLHENFETTSAMGRLVLHILAALAEFERGLISERTRAGMAAAKRRGKRVGPEAKITGKMVDEMQALRDKGWSARRIADSVNGTFGLRGSKRIAWRSVYNYTTQPGVDRKPARQRPRD